MTDQLNLAMTMVPLTPEEHVARGQQLAELLLGLVQMENEHAERRKAMKEAESELALEIARLRDIVRYGQEERPVGTAR